MSEGACTAGKASKAPRCFPPHLGRLTFKVQGDLPVSNFRMIERHYFKGRLIRRVHSGAPPTAPGANRRGCPPLPSPPLSALRSYDFSFPFCIPHSENNWESIYDVRTAQPAWRDQPFASITARRSWSQVPALGENEIEEFVSQPFEHVSDRCADLCLACLEDLGVPERPRWLYPRSFYFVDGKLVMHNKAEYSYSDPDEMV